eukprot:tig00021178_g19208.t1
MSSAAASTPPPRPPAPTANTATYGDDTRPEKERAKQSAQQRQTVGQYDKFNLPARPGDALGDEADLPVCENAGDVQWFLSTEENVLKLLPFALRRQYKKELYEHRLRGQEFEILVRSSLGAIFHAYQPLVLEITPNSQIVLYKVGALQKAREDLQGKVRALASTLLPRVLSDSDIAGHYGEPPVENELLIAHGRLTKSLHYIDDVKRIRPEALPRPAASLGLQVPSPSYLAPPQAASAPPPPEDEGAEVGGLCIEWRDGREIQFLTSAPHEVMELLGAHMARFNRCRIFQARRLREAQLLMRVPYSSERPDHEALLMRLWRTAFPGVALTARRSAQWSKLGFQGMDPATDFRGMGLLGLHNLVYFVEGYPAVVREVLTAEPERGYPFAAAGINITRMLTSILHLDSAPQKHGKGDGVQPHAASPAPAPPAGNNGNGEKPGAQQGQQGQQGGGGGGGADLPTWETPLFKFFCHLYDQPSAFEELYCLAFQVLDRIWVRTGATYLDFPRVLALTRRCIEGALGRAPGSLEEMMEYSLEEAAELPEEGEEDENAPPGAEAIPPSAARRAVEAATAGSVLQSLATGVLGSVMPAVGRGLESLLGTRSPLLAPFAAAAPAPRPGHIPAGRLPQRPPASAPASGSGPSPSAPPAAAATTAAAPRAPPGPGRSAAPAARPLRPTFSVTLSRSSGLVASASLTSISSLAGAVPSRRPAGPSGVVRVSTGGASASLGTAAGAGAEEGGGGPPGSPSKNVVAAAATLRVRRAVLPEAPRHRYRYPRVSATPPHDSSPSTSPAPVPFAPPVSPRAPHTTASRVPSIPLPRPSRPATPSPRCRGAPAPAPIAPPESPTSPRPQPQPAPVVASPPPTPPVAVPTPAERTPPPTPPAADEAAPSQASQQALAPAAAPPLAAAESRPEGVGGAAEDRA